MKWTSTVAAAAFAAVAWIGEAGAQGDTFLDDVQGTWVACAFTVGIGDEREVLTISGTSVSVVDTVHESADGSCSGAVTQQKGPYVAAIAPPGVLEASLDGATVLAHALDLEAAAVRVHTLAHLDPAAPGRLYLGHLGLDAGLDGSSPEARPVVLRTAPSYVKQ